VSKDRPDGFPAPVNGVRPPKRWGSYPGRGIFGRSQKFDGKHARKREKYVKQEVARMQADCGKGAPVRIVTIVARDS
jgi:hypothetical protein